MASPAPVTLRIDPITFEVVKNGFIATTDEMGVVLRRSSFSSNIKERKDFSCALFDPKGQLIAEAEHIPVHLGAMPQSVRAVLSEFRGDISEGDSFILNDPYHGGTHLPDITVVQPIFQEGVIEAFAVNRAHHADVGGQIAGSMSPLSTDISQEGVLIPPTKLRVKGRPNKELLDSFLSRVRGPRERLGDLRAQEAANNVSVKRLAELRRRVGLQALRSAMDQLIEYSWRLMKKEIRKLPQGTTKAVDYLDDDGQGATDIPIKLRLEVDGDRVNFDFTGSARQVRGALNAVYSVTLSAVYYAIRCVTDPTIPANAGCFKPVTVAAPEGTIVNAKFPAAVVGGNVETSQRTVDTILKAFSQLVPGRICAGCQSTMNNVTIGGMDPRTRRYFTYYETIAGGFGARKAKDGIDGIHCHMTNTMNTPIEALEFSYPFRVRRYELARGTGGEGKFRGGTGIKREFEVLADNATVTLFGDRQKHQPWGLNGGLPGQPGLYSIISPGSKKIRHGSKIVTTARLGTIIRIRTPGGGGYGNPLDRSPQRRSLDRLDEKV